MQENSIRNALFCGLTILLLSACGTAQEERPTIIETRTVEIQKPKPIVPKVDQLKLKEVKWIIITPENVDEIFANLPSDKVLFSVTATGYENLALNLNDLRSLVQQQKKIIAVYENSYR